MPQIHTLSRMTVCFACWKSVDISKVSKSRPDPSRHIDSNRFVWEYGLRDYGYPHSITSHEKTPVSGSRLTDAQRRHHPGLHGGWRRDGALHHREAASGRDRALCTRRTPSSPSRQDRPGPLRIRQSRHRYRGSDVRLERRAGPHGTRPVVGSTDRQAGRKDRDPSGSHSVRLYRGSLGFHRQHGDGCDLHTHCHRSGAGPQGLPIPGSDATHSPVSLAESAHSWERRPTYSSTP